MRRVMWLIRGLLVGAVAVPVALLFVGKNPPPEPECLVCRYPVLGDRGR